MKVLRPTSILLLAAAVLAPVVPAGAAPQGQAFPELVNVTARHSPGVDRVTFQFDDGVPAHVHAGFVRRLVMDGSGLPVRISARAVLQVSFDSTKWVGGIAAPRRRAFATPNVITAVRSGLFEGTTTYGIGLARRTSFTVVRHPASDRVVVEVRAAFPTVDRKVYFLDKQRFIDNQPPFFVARTRPVPAATPATGILDRLFAGPLPVERAQGLRLVRSHARGFADLAIAQQIARVRLTGGCDSDGSTVTIAGEIMPTLRQFDTVDFVKIFDPQGHTTDPTGDGDSIPLCLNP